MPFIPQFCTVFMEATGTGMRSGYAESHVVVHVQKPHATQLLTTAEPPMPATALLCISGSVWPPNSKLRRFCHRNDAHCSSSCGYRGKPKTLLNTVITSEWSIFIENAFLFFVMYS